MSVDNITPNQQVGQPQVPADAQFVDDAVSFSPNTYSEANVAFRLQDPDEVIEACKHSLRREGYVKDRIDKDGNTIPVRKWMTPTGIKPMINEEGISDIESILRDVMNNVAFLGNIDRDVKNNIIRNLGDEIALILELNGDKYEIPESCLFRVANAVVNSVELALTHPLGAGDKNFLRNTERRSVIVRQGDGDGKRLANGYGLFG